MYRARMLGEDDCLRSAVASLLHLPAVEVPHFKGRGGYAQMRFINRWLRKRGWSLVEVAWEPKKWSPVAAPYLAIATVEWGISGDHHCVVASVSGRRLKVVWDPAGFNAFNSREDRVISVLVLTRAIPPRP